MRKDRRTMMKDEGQRRDRGGNTVQAKEEMKRKTTSKQEERDTKRRIDAWGRRAGEVIGKKERKN